MQFLSRKYKVKPVVAIFAAVFTHQEVTWLNCISFCRWFLLMIVVVVWFYSVAKKANNVYVSYVLSLFLTDLMGYPALWLTLTNEVSPKRRKCKAKNCCINLESFGKKNECELSRKWRLWRQMSSLVTEIISYMSSFNAVHVSDFSLYIGVNMLLLPCFIDNKTVQKKDLTLLYADWTCQE